MYFPHILSNIETKFHFPGVGPSRAEMGEGRGSRFLKKCRNSLVRLAFIIRESLKNTRNGVSISTLLALTSLYKLSLEKPFYVLVLTILSLFWQLISALFF